MFHAGRTLRNFRECRALNRDQMGLFLGVTRDTIQTWERRAHVRLDTIERYAIPFGLTVGQLLDTYGVHDTDP